MDALARPHRRAVAIGRSARDPSRGRIGPRAARRASPSFRLRVSYRSTTRVHVRLLGPCFKTGREVADATTDPERAATAAPDGRREAGTANGTRRLARPPADRPPTPSREARAHFLGRPGPTRPRCQNTRAERGCLRAALLADSNRSWLPGTLVRRGGTRATTGGARASDARSAPPRPTESVPAPDGPSRLLLDGFTYS